MSKLSVPITRLPLSYGLPLPAYASAGAAGMDLCAAIEAPVILPTGHRQLIPTGFAIALPDGYEAQIRPRSGLALRHGLTVLNSPGTIDADYRGEIGVILANFGGESFTLKRGMRIAQLVIAPVIGVIFETMDELPATDRGAGGFGSTGIEAAP